MDPFEEVYHRHCATVWAVLRRLGVERAELEDAVQDVFVVAHRRRGAFTEGTSMRAWLLAIARRVASDHRRRRRRHQRRLDGWRRQGPQPAAPDDALWCSEGARLLHRFLAELDDGKREIFVLVELEQLTGREAAAMLGLNRNTAVARLRAARRAFDDYARGLRQSPPRVLAAARREPPPEPRARQRVLALVMLRIGEGGGGLGAVAEGGPTSASPWTAAAISVALAGATLGGIAAVSTWWSPPRAAGHWLEPGLAGEALDPARAAEIEEAVVTPPQPSVTAMTADTVAPELTERASASAPRIRGRPPSPPTSAPALLEGEDVDPLRVHAEALRRARAALRNDDPERALSIVAEVVQAHPTGGLALELALVRIHALCARGQRAQARGEARVLQREHPGSPVAALASCPEPGDP